MPKVSVIIPVFGVEKYIERCARSLFEQTLDDIEYLFIDDCTPDESISVLKRVMEKYPHRKPQVKIHRMEHNFGQAKVREWGMKNASGEYVIHCDSDDWVDTDMYRAMYEKAKENGSDVVISDYYIVRGDKIDYIKGFERTDKKKFIEDMMAMRASWALWNKLVKRVLINSSVVYPKDAMGEDMALTLQIILEANNISFIRNPFYFYVINPTSITQQICKEKIMDKYRQFLNNSRIATMMLSKENYSEIYKNTVIVLKWDTKKLLWQNVYNKDFLKLWKETYREINKRLLFCPLIKFSDKLKYILTYMRLYPFH